ncbi:ABC transporter permease [Ruegeria sp.]|uniref:ABC transporter permease n=1 Tax=Ruegeria sp. TaxID=1879320 RepID=UPI002317D740|nr:ABC transporter permease [Ruegeria sp.]MDA7966825.1 ABC transporter permease [Ruegeria sp.]
MEAISSFRNRYGAILTTYVFVGCATWLIGMIVAPQLLMVQKSLMYSDPAAAAAVSQTKASTDRLFVEKGRAEREVRKVEADIQAGGAAEADQSGGGVFNPFGSSGNQNAGASVEELEARRDELIARLGQIDDEIAANDSALVDAEKAAQPRLGLQNYFELFSNDANRPIFFKTIWSSILVTLIALIVCYPVAFYLAVSASKETTALLMLGLIVPYWVNEILRTFSWLMLLSSNGLINQALIGIGLADTPIDWRSGNSAVLIGMVYAYILFMVFPIYNTVETLDKNQIEAARDLGAPRWMIHWTVVIPHAKPGIAVGCIMTFMLAAGSYAVPVMLGSTTSKWFTEIIYDQFYEGGNWGLGSAYAFVLLITCILFIMMMMRLFRVNLQDIAK